MKFMLFAVFVLFSLVFNLSYARRSLIKGLKGENHKEREKSDSYESLKAKILEKDSADRTKQKNMYNGLLKFMLKQGAVIRKFSVKYATNSNRYIYATRNIKKNEVIARIPKKLMIFIGNKEIQEFDKKLKNIKPMLKSSTSALFGLWILHYKKNPKKGSETFFRRYFDLLPSDNSNMPALFKNEEENTYFKSSRILRENLEDKVAPLKEDFRNLQANGYISKNLKVNDYIEAALDFESRNFGIYYKGVGEVSAMIPFVDLFNYDEKKNIVSWEYNNEKKEFVIWADDNIKKGQEILLQYGEKSKQHFLENYGFTTPDIHDEELTIEHDGLKMTLSKVLNKDSYHETLKPVYEKFMKEGSTSRTETRIKALNFFITAVKSYMTGYKTSLKSDTRRLKMEKSFVMKNILRVLVSEKRIFNYYLKAATEELANVNALGDEHETAARDENIVFGEAPVNAQIGFRGRKIPHHSHSQSHSQSHHRSRNSH